MYCMTFSLSLVPLPENVYTLYGGKNEGKRAIQQPSLFLLLLLKETIKKWPSMDLCALCGEGGTKLG